MCLKSNKCKITFNLVPERILLLDSGEDYAFIQLQNYTCPIHETHSTWRQTPSWKLSKETGKHILWYFLYVCLSNCFSQLYPATKLPIIKLVFGKWLQWILLPAINVTTVLLFCTIIKLVSIRFANIYCNVGFDKIVRTRSRTRDQFGDNRRRRFFNFVFESNRYRIISNSGHLSEMLHHSWQKLFSFVN